MQKRITYADLFHFKFVTAKQAYLISLTPRGLCHNFCHTFSFLLKLLMPLHALSFSASDLDSRSLRQKEQSRRHFHILPWPYPPTTCNNISVWLLLWLGRDCSCSQQEPTSSFVRTLSHSLSPNSKTSASKLPRPHLSTVFLSLNNHPHETYSCHLKTNQPKALSFILHPLTAMTILCSIFQLDSFQLSILVISGSSPPTFSWGCFIMLLPTVLIRGYLCPTHRSTQQSSLNPHFF